MFTQIAFPSPLKLNRKGLLPRGVPFLAAVLLVLSACIVTAQQSDRLRPETVSKVKQATVRLVVPEVGKQGSGVLIGNRLLYTAAHVLGMLNPLGRPPSNIEVVVNSGASNEKHLTGHVVAVNRKADQAVVKVEGEGRLPAPLRVANNWYEGEKVFSSGFPGGSRKISDLSISRLYKNATGALKILFNGRMSPGASGGPVVNAQGELVGLIKEYVKGTAINFASPLTKVQTGRLTPEQWVAGLRERPGTQANPLSPFKAKVAPILPNRPTGTNPLGVGRNPPPRSHR